jgi:adenine/guanine phosphoribosyltransferase-like PRPP-binding protein
VPGRGERVGCDAPRGDGAGTTGDYSRFKHGDGKVAEAFGAALARLWLARRPAAGGRAGTGRTAPRPIVVTSAGYDVAPPAAWSLVEPFVRELRAAGVDVETASIHRDKPSASDYAALGRGARSQAIAARDLTVPPAVRGAEVVVLDDVRVTGTHERAMTRALRRAGASRVQHLYVARVRGRREDPTIESDLNRAEIRTMADLLALASAPAYLPNARVARWVLALPDDELDEFVAVAPPELLDWLARVACVDGVARLPRYRGGAERLRSAPDFMEQSA